MVKAKNILQLSKKAFWDVDMANMDYEVNADFIVRKVFDYGDTKDILEVLAFYGDERVGNALVTASYLMQKSIVFASKFLKIPLQSFKCFTTKQYHPIS
jgi:hypothetical protein